MDIEWSGEQQGKSKTLIIWNTGKLSNLIKSLLSICNNIDGLTQT
jgi:hypothetical protein